MLSVGDKAPQFTLNDADGNKVKLSDFKGKKVVLYFYPKDLTSSSDGSSVRGAAGDDRRRFRIFRLEGAAPRTPKPPRRTNLSSQRRSMSTANDF